MSSSLFHNAVANTRQPDDLQLALHIAQAWLVLGGLAVICVPALRGSSEWLGWTPFWLVGAPLADLLILRWRSVLNVSRTTLAHWHRRRAVAAYSTARAGRKSRGARRRPAQNQIGMLLTALLSR